MVLRTKQAVRTAKTIWTLQAMGTAMVLRTIQAVRTAANKGTL